MDIQLVNSLMLVYKETQGAKELDSLIFNTHEHLLICVRSLRNKYVFIGCEEEDEVYQLCVIGLIKACKSWTEAHDRTMLGTRIYMYAKQECFSTFRKFFAEKCGTSCEFLENADFNQTEDHVLQDMAYEELDLNLQKSVKSGLMEQADYDILMSVGRDGRTFKLTSEIFKISVDQVSSRYKKTISNLRTFLLRENYIF